MNTSSTLVDIYEGYVNSSSWSVFFRCKLNSPFVAHRPFLSLKIIKFNSRLILACQKMFPSPFTKCRKDVPNPALIWVLCGSHFQTTFRSGGDIVQVTFVKSRIYLKLFKDLEINLLKMMCSKEHRIKA